MTLNREKNTHERLPVTKMYQGVGLLLAFAFSLMMPRAFAEPELVCPCLIENVGQTAWGITTGLANPGATTTDNLRLRITVRDVEDTEGFFAIVGLVGLGAGMTADEARASATYKGGIGLPLTGVYIATLELQEQQSGVWTTIDSLRMREPITLESVGGASLVSGSDALLGAVYFDGTAEVVSIAGGNITIDVPAIVNGSGSYSTGDVQLMITRTTSVSAIGQFFTLGSEALGVGIPAGTSIAAQQLVTGYSEFGSGDYVHLVVQELSTSSFLAWQTIRVISGAAIPERTFTLHGIELLLDDDVDGVSNFNERFAGTDPADGSSTPGASVIDVLVKYTPGVEDLYPGAVAARIDHVIGFSNTVLAASEVNATLNVVGMSMADTNELFTLGSILDLMDAEQQGFEDLEAERAAVGADLVVTFIPFPGGALCGLANLGGQGKKGDLTNPVNARLAHATVYIDCRDNVTIHEVGHVMGLTHSRIESARDDDTGTFDWSVGHGALNSFATIMANTDDFGGNNAEEVNVFSNPDLLCDPTVDVNPPHDTGVACGVAHTDLVNGADASLSLETVRFQVAAFREAVGATDTDGDGMTDDVDTDDDNDGVADVDDAFPLDAAESLDTDSDGTGNNADDDDDGDGVADGADVFPLDASESLDTDSDGTGNNADDDDDGDGVVDAFDAFPLDPTRSVVEIASNLKPTLACPCLIENVGQTAWGITAGLANPGAATTDNLRLRITVRDVEDTEGFFAIVGLVGLGAGMGADETRASDTYKAGIGLPLAGLYIATLELQEEQSGVWTTIDSLRMREPITLESEGGASLVSGSDAQLGAVYFDGTAEVVSIAGGNITIDIPAIVNGSATYSTDDVQFMITRTATVSAIGQFFTLGSEALGVGIPAGTSIAAQQLVTGYSEFGDGDYVHLVVQELNTGSFLAWQTIRVISGAAIPERTFTLHGIELLLDDDVDGVSNFNERFAGTDPADGASTPGASVIDVLVKYTPGVEDLYPGAVAARIDHVIGFSNTVLAASGVNATLNVVGMSMASTNELFTLGSILDLMDVEDQGFEGLEAERAAVGADVVVTFIPFPGGSLCGLANLGGQGKKGDLTNPVNARLAHATVYIDCRDNVTIHEVGHVMGLTHSRIESAREEDTGTFDWSVGHGSLNSFATIMANTDDFGGNNAEEVNVFSNPDLLCDPTVDLNPPHTTGVACGVAHTDLEIGADASLSLETVRFQVAAFREAAGAIDTDGDGITDDVDTDDDNDGVADVDDVFPLDAAESVDTDSDGTGNNADDDDDDDGVPDTSDAFPLDASESLDTDGDGTGNNADDDDDDDGVPDASDAFPLDPTRSAENTSRLQNISTRGRVLTGDEVMIGGLIITGTEDKTVLIRARGPSLADAGVPGVLPDPTLELFEGANLLETNDDWADHPRSGEIPAALQPTQAAEAAIVRTLGPGGYTAIVRGVSSTGVGIVEIFELTDTGVTRLSNISTRGSVGTGDDVMIGGVIVAGEGDATLLLRARGPSLTDFGVAGALGDPSMELFDATGSLLESNDNWQTHSRAGEVPASLQPTNANESAIVRTVAPGAYTAVVRGVGETTGVGIVEVFELDN